MSEPDEAIPRLLKGRAALVTGASGGIGRAIVERLVRSGARVAAVDRTKSGPDLGETCFLSYDLTRIDGLAWVVAEVEKFVGPLDVLVNNAGVIRTDPLLELSYEDFRRVVSVNLEAPVFLALQVARGMAERHYGRIVNVTSVQGDRAVEYNLAYGVSKAGLNNATKALAVGLSRDGVLVNAVAPGFLAVPMVYENEKADQSCDTVEVEREQFRLGYIDNGRLPIGRAANAAEVAAQVAWLASEHNSYVTGHVLVVDGGLTATF